MNLSKHHCISQSFSQRLLTRIYLRWSSILLLNILFLLSCLSVDRWVQCSWYRVDSFGDWISPFIHRTGTTKAGAMHTVSHCPPLCLWGERTELSVSTTWDLSDEAANQRRLMFATCCDWFGWCKQLTVIISHKANGRNFRLECLKFETEIKNSSTFRGAEHPACPETSMGAVRAQ